MVPNLLGVSRGRLFISSRMLGLSPIKLLTALSRYTRALVVSHE